MFPSLLSYSQHVLSELACETVALLQLDMVPITVFCGDIIIEVGDRSLEMFFVTAGELEVGATPPEHWQSWTLATERRDR